ncbi:mediator complex subunit [Coemansia erecta]|uniref:Mediator of RNA polymerase II transcription subunit 14 n=1 Tax=Coemansia erecta TaxID=147472 RepID=A0A9W7XY92_9FUNG|nr:mediator complex subunit [Coemansia erecta]
MWSTVQRVPSQSLRSSESTDRTQVPGTPNLSRYQSAESPSMVSNSQQMDHGDTDIRYRNHHQSQSQQQMPNGAGIGGSIDSAGSRINGTGSIFDGSHPFDGHSSNPPIRNGGGYNGNGGSGGEDGNSGSRGTNNGDFSDSEDTSDAEELPQISVHMVPLSVIVGRLVTYAYTELVTLVDTLPSRTDADRRAEILKYTEHMSDLLTKLLVLVRWARNAPQIQKCQNVIAYLDSQNRFFEHSVDYIYATHLIMPNVRMRNYDVGNAVDILTTGTYQRLPSAIKRAVPPPKLSKKQIRETLNAVDDIIRGRILRGEPIPQAMRQYRIANGKIVFTVPKEFEATLTLLQYEQDIPWHIVGVRVLVSGDKSLPDEQQIVVNTWQIVDRAQHLLIESSAANVEASSQQSGEASTPATTPGPVTAQTPRPPQLAQLYDFLHRQCLVVLLETIVKQAAVLRRTRWENLLQIDMSPDRSVLTLRYWTSSRAASSHHPTAAGGADNASSAPAMRGNVIVFRLEPLPVPRPIHASAIEGPDALEASPKDDHTTERGEFLRIERDRRNLIPKVGLNVTWSAQSGLVSPKVWTRTVSQASELTVLSNADSSILHEFDMALDAEEVDTEKLLRQVTWRHARTILESLHKSVAASGLFSENAVELLYATSLGAAKQESELTPDEINLGTATPKLRAWYRQSEGAVDITVDAYTGRLVVRASEVVATSTSLSEAMVSQLADQLNRAPWRLAELLVDMRSSLALVDLDSLAFRSLGLCPQSSQGTKAPALPGFVLTGIYKRMESSGGPPVHATTHIQHAPGLGAGIAGPRAGGNGGSGGSQGATPLSGGMAMMSPVPQPVSAAGGAAGPGFQQSAVMAANFPLRVSQQDADALVREVAGVDNPLSRIRFYKIEGTEGVEEQLESVAGSTMASSPAKGEWYIMVAMTDRLRFRLVLLNPHPSDRLMFVIGQVISLQVDRLFSSVARRLRAEKRLDEKMFAHPRSDAAGSKRSRENGLAKADRSDGGEREITEKVDDMLTGRTSITLDYLNALASTCRARLALRLLQTQLTRWRIPYSFRLPSFSTSPHGHRAVVSKELSVVGLDKMGLYELDEQVPTLYIPIAALMRASPINWSVANMGVLPDESRRMVSIRIASDELDPSMRADLSPSTRVDQHRQAALAKNARKTVSFAEGFVPGGSIGNMVGSGIGAGGAVGGAPALQHGAKHSLIGRHVVPCQVIASIPVALDGLPTPVAQAYADAVYFGAHAASDGGYHRSDGESGGSKVSSASGASGEGKSKGGYSKMVLVYKQVSRALQCLIRDWSEHHLMTHIGRHMYSWEQRSMRKVLASTMAFYPFNSGPYTGAVANALGSWRGHQSTEIVIQCLGACYLSISCRVPYPFANEDTDKSMYPPDYEDSGGSDLTYHLTLADVDGKTQKIRRIASTWPWVFAHNSRSSQDTSESTLLSSDPRDKSGRHQTQSDGKKRRGSCHMTFEVSTSMSRWLRTLQARLNLTGNPLTVLSMIVQLMPINHMLSAISSQDFCQSMSTSFAASADSDETQLRLKFKDLVGDEAKDAAEPESQPPEDVFSHQFMNKLGSIGHDLGDVFDSVRGLNVMYMYTAADNIRLVFNSRYVVDMRLVSSDMFHVRDVVGDARSFNRNSRSSYAHGAAMAPEPLVTAATEPIPLFGTWLEAMTREMVFDWAKFEKGVSDIIAILEPQAGGAASTATAEGGGGSAPETERERIRSFQCNLFRLRPNASKVEQMMFKFRELFNKQNSTKTPTLVPLPPSGLLCSRVHMVAILRSLMQWLVQSVHLRDQLESAISLTQDIIEQKSTTLGSAADTVLSEISGGPLPRMKEPLFSIKEKLVVRDDMDKNDAGVDSKQVMIVGFTGAKESVRCEFLMQTGASNSTASAAQSQAADTTQLNGMDVDEQKESLPKPSAATLTAVSLESTLEKSDDDSLIMKHLFDLYVIPSDLMHVDLDVRIVPMNRPPNGITDAAANFLVGMFKRQKSSNRHRAGTLVRILALPPQLVMDTVDIARKLENKVSICALRGGFEHDIRLDSPSSSVIFSIQFCNRDSKWQRLFIQYALITGTARVLWAIDPKLGNTSATDAASDTEKWTRRPDAMLDLWNGLLAEVIAAMDGETAFTRDMGKSGKSRWYDIVSRLYEAQLASPLVVGGSDTVDAQTQGEK